jgi:hypothetical protein
MSTIRIASAVSPFDTPRLARSAAQVISKAFAMGLLEGVEVRRLDAATFDEVVDRIAGAGIGAEVQSALATRERPGTDEMNELLGRLDTALEDSPTPAHEWHSLEKLFGADRLAELVGVSAQSVRRYREGTRATPDAVAGRLHYLATLVGDLAGAYNDFGIRRWFERPRKALDGRAPQSWLRGEWSPDASGPRRVRDLARTLTGSPAT